MREDDFMRDEYDFSKGVVKNYSDQFTNEEKLKMILEAFMSFSELDNACDIEFRSKGKEFNSFDLIDKTSNIYDYLSLMIIDNKAKNYDYKYENETNIIKIKI